MACLRRGQQIHQNEANKAIVVMVINGGSGSRTHNDMTIRHRANNGGESTSKLIPLIVDELFRFIKCRPDVVLMSEVPFSLNYTMKDIWPCAPEAAKSELRNGYGDNKPDSAVIWETEDANSAEAWTLKLLRYERIGDYYVQVTRSGFVIARLGLLGLRKDNQSDYEKMLKHVAAARLLTLPIPNCDDEQGACVFLSYHGLHKSVEEKKHLLLKWFFSSHAKSRIVLAFLSLLEAILIRKNMKM